VAGNTLGDAIFNGQNGLASDGHCTQHCHTCYDRRGGTKFRGVANSPGDSPDNNQVRTTGATTVRAIPSYRPTALCSGKCRRAGSAFSTATLFLSIT
jgi:hypothetical protein